MILAPGWRWMLMMTRVSIGPGGLLNVFHAIDDRSYIGEADGRAVAVGNDEGTVAIAGDELIVRAYGIRLVRAVEGAFGLIHVGLTESSPQIFQTHTIGSERRRIRLDSHGGALAAADADKADAGKLRDFLRESRVGEIFDFGKRQGLGRECESQNRGVAGLIFAVDRRLGSPWGRRLDALLMAAWTSCSAMSMFRSR